MKGDVMSWKQVFVAYLKILSHDSPPDSEKNNRNFSPDSGQVGYVRTATPKHFHYTTPIV
jgi:hypothetical protein